jgi:hypothetical protein
VLVADHAAAFLEPFHVGLGREVPSDPEQEQHQHAEREREAVTSWAYLAASDRSENAAGLINGNSTSLPNVMFSPVTVKMINEAAATQCVNRAGCARRPVRSGSSRSCHASISALSTRRRACSSARNRSPASAAASRSASKSTIKRIAQKLEGRHWMYRSGSKRLDLIKMCDKCRVAVVAEEDFPRRPAAPTRAHQQGLSSRAGGAKAGVEA